MDLELSDGKIINNPTSSDTDDAISKIGSGLDHCILGDGDNYIQTAGGANQLFVQYQEGGVSFESNSNRVSTEQVKEMFRDYLAGGSGWKTMIPFQPMDMGSGGEAAPGAGSSTVSSAGTASFSAGSLKDTFTNAAKQEAVNSVSYIIRRFVRKFFRGFF